MNYAYVIFLIMSFLLLVSAVVTCVAYIDRHKTQSHMWMFGVAFFLFESLLLWDIYYTITVSWGWPLRG